MIPARDPFAAPCQCGCGRHVAGRFARGHNARRQFGSPSERLAAHTEKSADSDCWLWTGACDQDGYGEIYADGRHERTHRLAYVLAHGAIPPGMFVLHSCDVPACVNPDHLRLGTHAENMLDMMARDRQSRGERRADAKLTEHDVRAIRQSPDTGVAVGRRYQISDVMVRMIRTRKKWKHVA